MEFQGQARGYPRAPKSRVNGLIGAGLGALPTPLPAGIPPSRNSPAPVAQSRPGHAPRVRPFPHFRRRHRSSPGGVLLARILWARCHPALRPAHHVRRAASHYANLHCEPIVPQFPGAAPLDSFARYRNSSDSRKGDHVMPLHFCHTEAPHKKLRLPEWYISNLMLDRALDAIVRRVKKFDRNHDIPYLAGYSIDGKTIYIDRHMPRTLKVEGRDVDTDRFLILHEEVEKTLINQLGLHYLHAHQIAARAEEAAVRAAGLRWRDYDRFMQKYVKRIGDERLRKVPPDLDLKPYRDEHDFDLLKRMSDAVEQGQSPKGIDRR